MDKSQNNKGSNASQNSTSTTQSTSTSNASSDSASKYSIVKDGWGSRSNFQGSYGLKMDPDGLEEGNAILDAFQEEDRRRK